MKALTICQPYAQLILLPETDSRHKRVENRRWYTNYRGPLLIHAGKSREWLEIDPETPDIDEEYDLPIANMAFGALVAVADLVACVDAIDRSTASYLNGVKQFPWLLTHQHAERHSFWWVLQNVRPFSEPIPWRGAQGLFEVPDEIVRNA